MSDPAYTGTPTLASVAARLDRILADNRIAGMPYWELVNIAARELRQIEAANGKPVPGREESGCGTSPASDLEHAIAVLRGITEDEGALTEWADNPMARVTFVLGFEHCRRKALSILGGGR